MISRWSMNNKPKVENGVDLDRGFDRWLQQGFPHHVCVVEGHHKTRFIQFASNFDVVVVQ